MSTAPDNTRMKIAFLLIIAVFMVSGLILCIIRDGWNYGVYVSPALFQVLMASSTLSKWK